MVRRPWLIPLLLTFAALAITGCGGSGDVKVPNVVGQLASEASAAIDDAELTPAVQVLVRGDDPAGKVFDTDPAPGTEVPEGSTVQVYVSGGPSVQEEPEPPAPKPTPAPKPKPAPTAQEQSGGWTGVHAENYRIAKSVCGAFPQEKVARDLGLPSSADAVTIAEEYASGYRPAYQQANFEGCLDDLP